MKSNTELLQPETYYHIYNRGINGEDIFKSENNYSFFLQKYSLYIEPVADTFAYCLLKNHFHFLVKTKAEAEIHATVKDPGKTITSVPHFIGKQFSHLFNSYAQATNKVHGRTGGLLETPFRRIPVENDAYFSQLIWYIHHNPQRHGFVDDFRDYPHSSYWSHLQNKKTKLKREQVLNWFGNKDLYEDFHKTQQTDNEIKGIAIEF